MTVRFFAYIRDPEYAGCKETAWPCCRDLRQLGEQLADAYGERFRRWYFSPDGENFGEEAIVLVNGRRAEFLNGIETALKEEDTVFLFPVVAGG